MSQRTVIIGGTSGIGRGTARRLAENGHEVIICGRGKERLEAALSELSDLAGPAGAVRDSGAGVRGSAGAPGTVRGEIADATDRGRLDELFAAIGPIDNLVVAATAPAGVGSITEIGIEGLRGAVDGKLLAHANAIQAAVPVLGDEGSITLVTAASAQSALPGTAGLAAVNGALETMVPVLALELAPKRVNAVSPGVIDTEWWDFLSPEAKSGAFASFAAATAVGRIGRPEDVADAIAFLIGNTFMTGHVLPCDGGGRLKPTPA